MVGPVENNTYVVQNDDGKCLVIDPAIGSQVVVDYLVKEKLDLQAILLTHGHCDHFLGLEDILSQLPDTPVYIYPEDEAYLTDIELNGSVLVTGQPYRYEGEVHHLTEGNNEINGFHFVVLHLPGHTPGGVALNFNGQCFTGDTLFAGSVGRTDFLGGDSVQLMHSIKNKLLKLSADTVVLSGHGPDSTLAAEASSNPFLTRL